MLLLLPNRYTASRCPFHKFIGLLNVTAIDCGMMKKNTETTAPLQKHAHSAKKKTVRANNFNLSAFKVTQNKHTHKSRAQMCDCGAVALAPIDELIVFVYRRAMTLDTERASAASGGGGGGDRSVGSTRGCRNPFARYTTTQTQ